MDEQTKDNAKVRRVQFHNGIHEWVAIVPGDAPRWFPTWSEAFHHAYWAARVRNVVGDVFKGLT